MGDWPELRPTHSKRKPRAGWGCVSAPSWIAVLQQKGKRPTEPAARLGCGVGLSSISTGRTFSPWGVNIHKGT